MFAFTANGVQRLAVACSSKLLHSVAISLIYPASYCNSTNRIAGFIRQCPMNRLPVPEPRQTGATTILFSQDWIPWPLGNGEKNEVTKL